MISGRYLSLMAISTIIFGCGDGQQEQPVTGQKQNTEANVKLITLDPGHFHAALVQKTMYPGIDPKVHVYSPGGSELEAHLRLINQYKERPDNPATWNEVVYQGNDYFNRMLSEKKGNVVVLSGNNRRKTEYIQQSIDAGLNVLADKPMAINEGDFLLLKQSFENAKAKNVLLYDIMTERSEITNILQRELAAIPEVFGELTKGTPAEPAIFIESVHHYYKFVSGNVLTRPMWFFDPLQQGEAIPDVGTHLVDLIQWEFFPEQTLDYTKDIEIGKSRIWFTPISISQFKAITKQDSFPEFLKKYVRDTVLQTHANGEINYSIKGVNARIIARWDYQAKKGGDTHYAIAKGTKAHVIIRQGEEEDFQPTLYVMPAGKPDSLAPALENAIKTLNAKYPGIAAEKYKQGFRISIPEKFKVGHEAHFGEVMERYLNYLKSGNLPAWEVPNMLTKYYITTQSLKLAEIGR